jgi:perosamine synthetase
VIVSPFTMSASAAVIVMQNAIPVFADIEADTYGLDPASVEARITPQTRAIVVTHLFGHPARMEQLLKLAERHDLAIVEDAAQSIGAVWNGHYTGTLGAAGVLSLNYHKIIHAGEGGLVLTDDPEIGQRARLVRNHGETVVSELDIGNIANTIGSNFRLGEIEAAIALEQLKKLDGLLAHRRHLAERLTARLSELPGVLPATLSEHCSHSYYVYPIRLELCRFEGVTREAIARTLRAEGIPVAEGYVRPLYLQPMYQRRIAHGTQGCPWTCGHWHGQVSYEAGVCPVAERLHDEELLLLDVCRAPLTEDDIDDVADSFAKVLGNLDALRRVAAV